MTSLRGTLRGSFTMRGASADSGSAHARRTLAGKRVQLRVTLAGTKGTITVRVGQACGSATGAWKALAGSRAYVGVEGGGRGRGRIPCTRISGSIRIVLTGQLTLPPPPPPPPPPPAQAGSYGGTAASDDVTFDVLADGRTLANWSVRQVIARCGPDVPPTVRFLSGSIGGQYSIAADGTFSIAESGYSVTGKFAASSASGTVSYELSQTDPFGTVRTCRSGPATWNARTPPPPPPAVEPGRYCGTTTNQNKRLCFDVTAELRIASFDLDVSVTCFSGSARPLVPLRFLYRGTIAIRADSRFTATISQFPLETGGQVETLSITGAFTGTRATGTFRLTSPQVVHEGTRYRCFSLSAPWTVSREG